MTLMHYARRKGWPLESISVQLTHERDYSQDCENCDSSESMEGGGVGGRDTDSRGTDGRGVGGKGNAAQARAIRRSITITGDQLTAQQRAKMIAMADKCPVHKALEGKLKIITTAVEPQLEEGVA